MTSLDRLPEDDDRTIDVSDASITALNIDLYQEQITDALQEFNADLDKLIGAAYIQGATTVDLVWHEPTKQLGPTAYVYFGDPDELEGGPSVQDAHIRSIERFELESISFDEFEAALDQSTHTMADLLEYDIFGDKELTATIEPC